MNRYKYALRMAFKFSKAEFWPFILAVVISGFILGFRSFFYWDADILLMDTAKGLSSSIYYSIIFLVLYFLFVAGQKFIAAYMGYECTLDIWKYGPVIGIFITFMTLGLVPFLYLGGVQLKENPNMRLGKYRHYLNVKDLMYVGLAGPLVLIMFLILIVDPLYFATSSSIFHDMMIAATWILLFSALPLPKTNGINILWKSRLIWLIYFIISLGLFILFRQLEVASYIAAAIVGVVALILLRKVASSGLFNL
ncbi:MAG: hypothetical protein ACP5N3_03435 [Candidatus Nanoarchaeia archaeon]